LSAPSSPALSAVALVALPVAFLVAHAYQAFIGSPAFAMPGTILVLAVSYAASLAATGLPLLAAELPGYRIAQAGAEDPGEWITYRLVPDSAPPELTPSVTYDQQVITVVISHAWPLFAPPAHCASDTATVERAAEHLVPSGASSFPSGP
jgi:hypothetical protein